MKEATRHCFQPEIVLGSETENLQILCRLLKVPLHGQCAHWKKLHLSQKNTYPHCPAYKGTQKGQKSSLAISLNFVLRLNHQLQVLDGQAFGSLEAQTYASLRPRIHRSMYLCIHAFIMHPCIQRAIGAGEHGWPSANGHVCGEHSSPLSSRFAFESFHLSHNSSWEQTPETWEMKCGKLLW